MHTVAVSEFGSRFVKGLCYLLAPEDSGRVAIHLSQQAGQRFGTCEFVAMPPVVAVGPIESPPAESTVKRNRAIGILCHSSSGAWDGHGGRRSTRIAVRPCTSYSRRTWSATEGAICSRQNLANTNSACVRTRTGRRIDDELNGARGAASPRRAWSVIPTRAQLVQSLRQPSCPHSSASRPSSATDNEGAAPTRGTQRRRSSPSPGDQRSATPRRLGPSDVEG